jgi:mRNA interferase MazF
VPGRVTRGTVVYVDLNPPAGGATVGHEIDKVRPCVVIQNNVGNLKSTVTIVAAIGDKDRFPRALPVWVPVAKGEGGTKKDCYVLCNHLHTVDELRFKEIWGSLTEDTMKKVDRALRISLAL